VLAFGSPEGLQDSVSMGVGGETGIAVQAITPALAAGLKLPVDSGVIISDVQPGSSAETAGLKVRDIITSIDGRPVDNLPALGTRLFMRRGGERINLGVLRASEKLNLEVPVVEPSHDSDRLAAIADPVKGLVAKLGILAVDVDAKIAPSLAGLRYASGVLVVAKDAGADIEVSLATGDVIHAINGLPVETVDGLRSALDHAGSGNQVVLQIEREGKLMFITVKIDNND
jgi:serine protease Do